MLVVRRPARRLADPSIYSRTMSTDLWILERCANERFPYRVEIRRDDRQWLALRVQDRWPTANRNIFCLRERDVSDDVVEEVERIPIVALQRRGRRLTVVLDRARQKRCDFLFLEREYKGEREGTYEQIFWQTQASMRQRRPRMRVASAAPRPFTVRIAHDERYPWRFPGATTERGRLPVGDYALVDGDQILAVVERKTFEDFLRGLNVMPMLHQRLLELAAGEQHALVVEAPYEHFLDTRKVHHLSPAFCSAAIAEIYSSHPRLRLVFCANRKGANEWTRHYFAAVWSRLRDPERGEGVPDDPAERDGLFGA
jgi:hypothetical protein